MEDPVVEIPPPHALLYQYQFAPELRFPPKTLSVLPFPEQMADGVDVVVLAGEELWFTVTVIDALLLIHCRKLHDNIIWPSPDLYPWVCIVPEVMAVFVKLLPPPPPP